MTSRAGSEFEWPTRTWPERSDETEALPREAWPRERVDDVFLAGICRSVLQSGQKVAFINQRSTHFAWKTCEHPSARQMSGGEEQKVSWHIAQISCLYVLYASSLQTTSSLCCTNPSGMRPRGMPADLP
jgi:hypothetical protein